MTARDPHGEPTAPTASAVPGSVAMLGVDGVRRRLQGAGLRLRTGPFVFHLRSPHPVVADGVARLYADNPLAGDGDYVDFDVTIDHGRGWRRWVKPQARFLQDGAPVYEPLPASHALPMLEWAMNASISTRAHHHLVLHAAVIEREGLCAILPAPPGSGKSTLCAGLIHAGWRLLSDELTLLSLDGELTVTPLCRPVSLKNASIDIIKAWAPQAVFSATAQGTAKGDVAHMRAPREALRRVGETARPRWVVFPRWQAGAAAQLTPRPRGTSMLELARNAFNYMLLGETGYQRLADLVSQCDCVDFRYARLDDAVATFDAMLQRARA